MAIAGLKDINTQALTASKVEEAVATTIVMLQRLELVDSEEKLRESLTSRFKWLAEMGDGRLYVRLPAGVKTSQLIELANTLAIERGFDTVFLWPNLWVSGTEANSLTEQELNGSTVGFEARLALFATDSKFDPVLHFTGLSYDDKYREKKKSTQLEKVQQEFDGFAKRHPGATIDSCDHRDFLVWYIMDLIRGVPASELALAQGFMRTPRHGRRTVDGDSCVGRVNSYGGQAELGGSHGRARDGLGVGLSVGFREEN